MAETYIDKDGKTFYKTHKDGNREIRRKTEKKRCNRHKLKAKKIVMGINTLITLKNKRRQKNIISRMKQKQRKDA